MNAEALTYYLRNPTQLHQISQSELQNLVIQYPYCQNLRYLLAKKSQLEQSADYQKHLQLAATYAVDRRQLYRMMTANKDGADNLVLAKGDLVELQDLGSVTSAVDLPETEKQESELNVHFDVEDTPLIETGEQEIAAPPQGVKEEGIIEEILNAPDEEPPEDPASSMDQEAEISSADPMGPMEEKSHDRKDASSTPPVEEQIDSAPTPKESNDQASRPENEDLLSLLAKLTKENKLIRRVRRNLPDDTPVEPQNPVELPSPKIEEDEEDEGNAAIMDELIAELETEADSLKALKNAALDHPENNDLEEDTPPEDADQHTIVKDQEEEGPPNEENDPLQYGDAATDPDDEKKNRVITDIPFEITNREELSDDFIEQSEEAGDDSHLVEEIPAKTAVKLESQTFSAWLQQLPVADRKGKKKKDQKKKVKRKKVKAFSKLSKKKGEKSKKRTLPARIKKAKVLEEELFQELKESILGQEKDNKPVSKSAKSSKKKKQGGLKLKKKEKKIKKKKNKPAKPQKKSKKNQVVKIANESLQQRPDTVSETLARLLADQGYPEMAILMYERLSLIFPEKSPFFALEIEKIKKNKK